LTRLTIADCKSKGKGHQFVQRIVTNTPLMRCRH